MLEKFEKFWNAARVIVLGIALSLFVVKAFCFAPQLEFKGPSRQQAEQDARLKEERNRKAWEKHQQNLKDAESNDDSEGKSEPDTSYDYSELHDYESNHCG